MADAGPQRAAVAIYTQAGWITGHLYLEDCQTLLIHLNHAGTFFSLTNVVLPLEDETRDFFAVHSSEATIVLPLDNAGFEGADEAGAETKAHAIACLMPGGTLYCTLDIFSGHRVSDHLMLNPGFIPIRNVTIPILQLPASIDQPIKLAYLNTSGIIGVTEANVIPDSTEQSDEDDRDSFTEM